MDTEYGSDEEQVNEEKEQPKILTLQILGSKISV